MIVNRNGAGVVILMRSVANLVFPVASLRVVDYIANKSFEGFVLFDRFVFTRGE
jgi:hypothetical protein